MPVARTVSVTLRLLKLGVDCTCATLLAVAICFALHRAKSGYDQTCATLLIVAICFALHHAAPLARAPEGGLC